MFFIAQILVGIAIWLTGFFGLVLSAWGCIVSPSEAELVHCLLFSALLVIGGFFASNVLGEFAAMGNGLRTDDD